MVLCCQEQVVAKMAAAVAFLAVPNTHPRRRHNLRHLYNPTAANQKLNTTHLSFYSQFYSTTTISQNAQHINTFPSPSHVSPLDSCAYAELIEHCNSMHLGRQIHSHALKRGFCGSREFLETKLVAMYGRCGSAETASLLFERMPLRNIYSWVGVLSAFVDNGYFEEALSMFLRLQFEEMTLEFFVFPVLLKACSGLLALEMGRQLHGFVIKGDFVTNAYVGNAVIDMYGKCGSLDEAAAVLNNMPERDCVSWNSMITACTASGMAFEALEFLKNMQLSNTLKPNLISWSAVIGGFSQHGSDKEALGLLIKMQESGIQPNAQTLASVLPACAKLQVLSIGKEIHGYVIRHAFMTNVIIANGLVDVYRRCGDMDSAFEIFSRFSIRNLVSFNTMIVGYFESGNVEKAKQLFDKMELHGVRRDTISWNSLISGYVDNGQFEKALEMFRHMQMEEGVSANSFTLGSVLRSCAEMTALRQGKELHSFAIVRGLDSDIFVGGALVEMYCKCQCLLPAQMFFDRISEKETAAWNALISGLARCNQLTHALDLLSRMRIQGLDPTVYTWNGILAGYVENGHYGSAVELFIEIQTTGTKPDIYLMGIVLSACTRLASIQWGKQAHAHLIRCGWDLDVHIGAALVDMYAKCGSISAAKRTFHRISQQNLVSYNTMLAGFAMHGLGKDAIALFHELIYDGLKPDAITFLSVLSSCTHEGSVEQGLRYFNLMSDFGVKPELKHYTCIIDLLSRAGHLDDAYRLVQRMPMQSDAVVWGALLSGCVVHTNVELGEVVADKLIASDECNAANYVMLANLYAAVGRHEDFAKVRQIIKDEGMHKIPGCSWIEDQGQVHVFVAGDRSHGQVDEIYEATENLTLLMRDVDLNI